MTEQLSNCCKAQVNVDSSDEGTSCFVCSKCKNACDLQVNEQISLEVEVNKCWHCNRIAELIKWHKYYQPCEGIGNFIEKEEYERLKRLDENREKLINSKKQKLDNFLFKVGAYAYIEQQIKELEGLDK